MAINPFVKMTATVLKSLFSSSACKMYPVEKPVFYANTKGHIGIQTDKCTLCTLCAKKCPTYAIEVDRNAKTWKIERAKCIMCMNCTYACPKKCLTCENQYSSPVTTKEAEVFNITPPQPVKGTDDCGQKENAA